MSDSIESSEDADDSSSSSLFASVVDDVPPPVEPPALLREFRQQWRQELSSDGASAKAVEPTQQSRPALNNGNGSPDKSLGDEERATVLFNQGSELEELGKVFEAMYLYRRAIQIVPDIEQRIYQKSKLKQQEMDRKSNKPVTKDDLNGNANGAQVPGRVLADPNDDDGEDEEEANLDKVDLMARFQAALRRSGQFLQKAHSNERVISTGSTLHISQLPMEIILYILRWVVSSELDMRSLDQCALVSKGLYICARDPEIWRLTCARIWGVQVGTLADTPYLSWRQMYMERPRINFSGCYIGKTSYWRFGENTFQDQNYRPIHLIEYYRYVRFFSNGEVIMLTTPEEPAQMVNKLKDVAHSNRNELMKGHFRFHGDVVIMAMKRNRALRQQQQASSGRGGSKVVDKGPDRSPTFCMELVIHTTGRRRANQLRWKSYSIISMQNMTEEVRNDLEVGGTMYPSLNFSRCKSYHSRSDKPLV